MGIVKLPLLLIIGLLSSAGYAAEVYRWVDENGKTHFGDKPKDKKTKSITVKQQPKISDNDPSGEQAPVSQEKLLDAYSERRQQKQAEKAREQKKVAERDKRCQKVKDYLDLASGRRIYKEDEHGKRVFLDSKEIDSHRKQHQATLKDCR